MDNPFSCLSLDIFSFFSLFPFPFCNILDLTNENQHGTIVLQFAVRKKYKISFNNIVISKLHRRKSHPNNKKKSLDICSCLYFRPRVKIYYCKNVYVYKCICVCIFLSQCIKMVFEYRALCSRYSICPFQCA